VVSALVQEADDRALLPCACEDWRRMTAHPALLAAYRAEVRALDSYEPPLPKR
jgi:hypothetical protein